MIKINYSHLKYPPIPAKKLPKFLIYEHPEENMYLNKYCTIASTKDGKMYGELEYTKSRYYRGNKLISAIYIENLEARIKHHGAGTALLNFVKNKSKKEGLGGKFYLSAIAIDEQKIPHPFYRKFGMTTGNPNVDKRLDGYNRQKKFATSEDFPSMLFYYNPQ